MFNTPRFRKLTPDTSLDFVAAMMVQISGWMCLSVWKSLGTMIWLPGEERLIRRFLYCDRVPTIMRRVSWKINIIFLGDEPSESEILMISLLIRFGEAMRLRVCYGVKSPTGNLWTQMSEERCKRDEESVKSQEALVEARGHEIALFIDTFIQKNNLPSISSGGGVALLGWSLGATFAPIVISSVDTLAEDIRRRLSEYILSLILYDYPKLNENAEPAPIALGLPTPKQNWTFLADATCASYFDHADNVGRDLDKLSWVLASPNRTPTFFNGLPLSIQRYGEDAATDLSFLFLFSKQILAAYRKAFFGPGVLPNMKRAFVRGDKSCAFWIVGLWAVQDDEQELWTVDAKAIKYKIIPGANHFVHWDDPEKALDAFIAMP
ncbi:hypothetical protein ARMGADRAFT_1028269 [Armillaria gallica]|uniref:AB hydrolase-1 domain-containing protein n=1 Tax=Armillaria gallica TaxID=47427 RepID=A0A2H3E3Y1_ARMGA|nr:hypothetical protein ARMGADRAFT_1028269 [Armillaria gallica]